MNLTLNRLLATTVLGLSALSLSSAVLAEELPADVKSYIKHRYGGDQAQHQAVTQLAKAYRAVAYSPREDWGAPGRLMAQAITMVRAEHCVMLRFAKSGLSPSSVMHNLQRALLTDEAGITGWNEFVASYENKMPPRVSGDTCE